LSQESFEAIIGKLLLDASFREALLAAPDQTLASFDLTEEEKTNLKRLDSETLEILAHTLAARLEQIRRASRDASFDLFTNKESE
jgi:hypothetical protein